MYGIGNNDVNKATIVSKLAKLARDDKAKANVKHEDLVFGIRGVSRKANTDYLVCQALG